jgi:phosphate transport system permease protein
LRGLCIGAAVLTIVAIGDIGYQIISGASLSIGKLGPAFLWHPEWNPPFNRFGAFAMIYGSAVTGFMALALALPIGLAIGLYLALLGPSRVAVFVGPLVEMLAAVPSVILGFWGIIILGPFIQGTVEPFLNGVLGFIPLFGPPATTGLSLFTAGLVLTMMILPIIASLSRDLFRTVPLDLQDGAAALGATRWEVIRGVVLPTTASGIAAAAVLALGRALGEAIAVAQVIGDGNAIHASLFSTGITLSSRIALTFSDAVNKLNTSAFFYLALILLVIGVGTNLTAGWIQRRFAYQPAR